MTSPPEAAFVRYKRNRFAARFPVACVYTPAHFWLAEESPGSGIWRVGLTQFALRMLGEIVEFDFEIEAGQTVAPGDPVGWIEGFKAVSDLFSVAEGEFVGPNPSARTDPESVCRDPYGEGWLYAVRGRPDPNAFDANGYIAHLDRAIDKMQGKDLP